jgi:heme/copper-type cytochrome/quinol oxidase subunit 1
VPFFFILPVWAFCVLVGATLLFFRDLRRIAYFVIAVPTGAMLVSFALSTSVLYLVPRVAHESHPQWFGIALMTGYLIALVVGALLGALAAFLVLVKLPTRKRV